MKNATNAIVDDNIAAQLQANTSCSHPGRKTLLYVDKTTGNTVLRCGGSYSSNSTGFAEIQCPAGYYCPNSTTRVLCPEGSSCRQGSTSPQSCPLLTDCAPGSPVPKAQGLVVVIVMVVVGFGMLLLYLLSNKPLMKRIIFLIKRTLGRHRNRSSSLEALAEQEVQFFINDKWTNENDKSPRAKEKLEKVQKDAFTTVFH